MKRKEARGEKEEELRIHMEEGDIEKKGGKEGKRKRN